MVSRMSVGNTLGGLLAGHSAFIRGNPEQLPTDEVAPHLFLCEAATAVPAFALSVNYYITDMIAPHSADRQKIIVDLVEECRERKELMDAWAAKIPPARSPSVWRGGVLVMQLCSFSVWLVIAAVDPGTVHQTLGSAQDHLLTKYSAIHGGGVVGMDVVPRLHRRLDEHKTTAMQANRHFYSMLVVLFLVCILL